MSRSLRHIVLDFDGTCTQVEAVEAAFLDAYRATFTTLLGPENRQRALTQWEATEAQLRALSPEVGWRLGGGPPSAPIAADPYILAGETAKRVFARIAHEAQAAGRASPPTPDFGGLHHDLNERCEAPWREEVPEVLAGFVSLGLSVSFVSNSSTTTISKRLDDLLGASAPLRRRINVFSDARKFSVEELELPTALPELLVDAFAELPAGEVHPGLRRPVYLRRGRYFQALAEVWGGPRATLADITGTLVCGDIYELDLAMPKALGCHVHLVDRQAPFQTCAYETKALPIATHKSRDLRGLLARARALVGRS
jgi:phosphoglycolate phosphatase-like HAD superfamily hydrolase